MKRVYTRAFLPALLAASVLIAACGLDPVTDARKQYEQGRTEEALLRLDAIVKADPANHVARNEYYRLRELLVAQWLGQAETLRASGELDAAEVLYRRVFTHDAANARARVGMAQLEMDRRHRSIIAAADTLAKAERYREAQDTLRPVLTENPYNREAQRLQRRIDDKLVKPAVTSVQLRSTATGPLTLELRDVSLRSAFDVLARATGVVFVFDRDVRADQRTTVVVREASVEEAIRIMLLPNQLEQKVLNDRTVLIFPNTPQKLREYQELVVRGFYVANADVKQTANMVRTLVKTRDIFVDEKLNLIVIKDTPNAIRLAEKLIAAQDLAEPEVMLEIEVLEIASNRLMELGLQFPDSVAWSLVGAAGIPGTLTLPEWLGRNAGLVRLTFPNPLFLLTLRQQDGSTSALANPRIRVKNKEKAKIHIGDRVPVITTTAAATGGFVSESVSYLDVGLKLEVEPLIYLEDEVGIKVGLEVSSIAREVKSLSTSTLTYQISTRNAATTLRLRDGETQILAGLISDEDRRTANRVPGLGDLPVIGRLFSSTSGTVTKNEIVLLITPRLLRTLARPEARHLEFGAGTDASSGAPGSTLGTPIATSPAAPPAGLPGAPTSIVPSPAPPPAPGASTTTPAVPTTPPSTPLPSPDMVPFGGVVVEPPR